MPTPSSLSAHSSVSKCQIWTIGDILTATGDLLVGLIAAVVINFGVGVVQDGPALGMLHGVAVTLVVHLAAPKQSLHHTFETGCIAARPGISALKYWPVQIIHRRAGASVSTVAAVVGVVEDGPAVGLHTQDHLPELVEGQVVQRLTWKQGKKQLESERCTSLRNVSRIRDVSLTDGEACSHEEHNLEGVHPGVCQEAVPTAHLNIFIYHVWDFGSALSAVHTTRRHTRSKVHTHSPWTYLNLELRICRDYGDLEEQRGWKHNKKNPTSVVNLYVLRLQKMQRKQRCIPATEIGITPSNLPCDRTNTPDAKMDKDTFNVWVCTVAEDVHSAD